MLRISVLLLLIVLSSATFVLNIDDIGKSPIYRGQIKDGDTYWIVNEDCTKYVRIIIINNSVINVDNIVISINNIVISINNIVINDSIALVYNMPTGNSYSTLNRLQLVRYDTITSNSTITGNSYILLGDVLFDDHGLFAYMKSGTLWGKSHYPMHRAQFWDVIEIVEEKRYRNTGYLSDYYIDFGHGLKFSHDKRGIVVLLES